MEALIHQAFLHVDVIGSHVHEGHYDLIGPDGEIILPQVWETMVKPDWSITMHMWPIASPPKEKTPAPPPGGFSHGIETVMSVPHKTKKGSKKDKKGSHGFGGFFASGPVGPPPVGPPPGGPPGSTMGPPPSGVPPPPPGGHVDMGMMPPGIMALDPGAKTKSKKTSSSSKKSSRGGMALWLAGGPSASKSSNVKRKK
jgi:hypothetical protein